MSETVYRADSALQHPLRFAGEALDELRHSTRAAWQLFRRDLHARHRRTWLGYAWLLLPSIATTLLWVYVQSRRIVSIAPTAIPYPVYVLTGTVLWQVFVDALNAPLQQLRAGQQLITRSRVPHEALILSGLLDVLFNAAVRLSVVAVVLIVWRTPVDASLLLVPFGLAALAVAGLTLGTFVAPLGMLYDDVGRAMQLITTFWFFLTPVIYPPAAAPRFNPVTPLLDSTRNWLTAGHASPGLALVAGATLPLLLLAWSFNRLARPHLIARLG